MNASTSLPFDTKSTSLAQSMVSELALKGPAGKLDIPPYFSRPTKWPVSAARLWGLYLKSLLNF